MNLRSDSGIWRTGLMAKYEWGSLCDMGYDELLSDTLMYDLWNLGVGWNDKTTLLWLEMITAISMNLMIVLFAGRLGG